MKAHLITISPTPHPHSSNKPTKVRKSWANFFTQKTAPKFEKMTSPLLKKGSLFTYVAFHPLLGGSLLLRGDFVYGLSFTRVIFICANIFIHSFSLIDPFSKKRMALKSTFPFIKLIPIPYFCLLVLGILVTLVACISFWGFFRLAHLALQNVNKDYVIFSYFCNFVAKNDKKPKTKNGMNETYNRYIQDFSD